MAEIIERDRLIRQVKESNYTLEDTKVLQSFIDTRSNKPMGCKKCPFTKKTKKGFYCVMGDYVYVDVRAGETAPFGFTNDLTDFALELYQTLIDAITAIHEGKEDEF